MTCALTTGRTEPCKDVVGGLKTAFFADFGTLGKITETSNEVSALGGAPSLYQFDLKGNSSFEQTITSSRENGTTFYEQVLNLELKKQDSATHAEIALLAIARPHIFVVDNNDNIFLMGLEFGADLTGGSIVTGAAMGDKSGYSLTFSGMEKAPAKFVAVAPDSTVAEALEALNDSLTIETTQINP